MQIEVLRIGQRLVRDDRATTHVALAARAFGAKKIFMTEANPDIKSTIDKINSTWGGSFEVEFIDNWRSVARQKKASTIVHLTMYGQPVDTVRSEIGSKEDILVIVGAEKVPRQVYELADYNVSVGTQPHSEISALAVFLDRIQDGSQFAGAFEGAKRRIIPEKRGKSVVEDGPN